MYLELDIDEKQEKSFESDRVILYTALLRNKITVYKNH